MSVDPLRPRTLAEFTGQDKVVRELDVLLRAAKAREELPEHILFAGPPGLGKTTLAAVVANELGLPMLETSGPVLAKPADIVSVLASFDKPTVVFVDEAHRMPRLVEEILYPAMEDGELDIKVGEGPSARVVRVAIRPFVLIAATTQLGAISAPMRDRFGYVARMLPYETEILAAIVERSARMLDVSIDHDAAVLLASRSRGTPRIANRLLRRVRDIAQLDGQETITVAAVTHALDVFQVDTKGLDALGVDVLRALCTKFSGGPVGVATLAAALNEPAATVESYEPFLMEQGLLVRTPRGRMATVATFEHLGLPVPAHFVMSEAEQPNLFGQPS